MRFKKIFFLLFMIIFVFVYTIPFVYAIENDYEVVNDLLKDKTFNDSEYPSKKNDYSMDVIAIAEGENNELYIYTYQPSDEYLDLYALKISMSNEFREGKECNNLKVYDLELISSFSVFDKYKVKDYTIPSTEERYYNIVCLYREYKSSIDDTPDSTITNAVGYEVGKQWCCYKQDGELVYESEKFKTIEIEVTLNDEILFKNGLTFGNILGSFEKGYCHYIAFNLEEKIAKKIYDADLNFKKRTVTTVYSITSTTSYSDWDPVNVFLSSSDSVSYDGKGLFSKDYTWNRITKGKDFISNLEKQDVDFTDETKAAVENSQWVFAFYESEYKSIVNGTGGSTGTSTITYEEVEEVAILRIHFKDILGRTYNLGVVSDITTSDKIPGGIGDPLDITDDFNDLIKLLLLIALIIIILSIINILKPLSFKKRNYYSKKKNK